MMNETRADDRSTKTESDLEKRDRLAALLREAAEVEHDVLSQYLFAAFSMKKYPEEGGVTWVQLEMMRRWEGSLLVVARQEMEHLALATNLLLAIGEAPHLRRPTLPLPPGYFPDLIESKLEKFCLDAVRRFVLFEMPGQLDPENQSFLEKQIKNFKPTDYSGIERLYKDIKNLFQEIDPDILFVGPPSAQFISTPNSAVAARGIKFRKSSGTSPTIYSIKLSAVTDLQSALQVIDQIMEEGEGATEDDPDSHFGRFMTMYRQMVQESVVDPHFEPGRNVATNPRTKNGGLEPTRDKGTPITNPDSKRMAELFDVAYETMMLLLMRYFAYTDETQEELLALQNVVFFPLMTVVIRPLGEMLTQLPLDGQEAGGEPAGLRAGPTFELGRSVSLLPHREAAWNVLLSKLDLMTMMVDELRQNEAFDAKMRDRLDLMYENCARMVRDFNLAMQVRRPQ
jgi:hypothetical protein